MSNVRTLAGLIAVICLGVFLTSGSAFAAHKTAAAACTTKVKGHSYALTHSGLSCSQAVQLVKTTAGQKLNPKNPGAVPHSPKGYKCSAYDNAQHVQTYGSCRSLKGSKYFDWTLRK